MSSNRLFRVLNTTFNFDDDDDDDEGENKWIDERDNTRASLDGVGEIELTTIRDNGDGVSISTTTDDTVVDPSSSFKSSRVKQGGPLQLNNSPHVSVASPPSAAAESPPALASTEALPTTSPPLPSPSLPKTTSSAAPQSRNYNRLYDFDTDDGEPVDVEGGPAVEGDQVLTGGEAVNNQEIIFLLPDSEVEPEVKWNFRYIRILISILVSLIVLLLPLKVLHVYAHRCAAMLTLVAIQWSTDAMPPAVTSLSIPLLTVLYRVLPESSVSVTVAANVICHKFFDPLIFLFLGGYAIASVLHKYGLSDRLATLVLRAAGTKPRHVLFAVMALGVFLSMWISNVASSVLCVSSVIPMIEALPRDSRFPKALLLGIAFSNNIGGMTTVIASPQNAIAVVYTQGSVSFLQWLFISVPFCSTALLVCWAIILMVVQPSDEDLPVPSLEKDRRQPMKAHHYFILCVIAFTISVWALDSWLDPITGNIGITALFPVLIFFGSGLLNMRDFWNLPWNILMLMGGGMALGYAIQTSKLLHITANELGHLLDGHNIWVINLVFIIVMLFVASIISSTVAAIILCPVLESVGAPLHHSRLLLLSGAIMISGSMLLPVSSFPNANSFAVMNKHTGTPYLKTWDYIKTGFPIGLAAIVLIQTMAFFLMTALKW